MVDERIKRQFPIVWRVLKRIRWWLVMIPLLTGLGSYISTYFMQDRYESSETISLQDEATFNNLLEDLVAPVDNKANTVSAQSLIITYPVLERIATKGDLLDENISEPDKRLILNNIASNLEINQDRETPEIVTLIYTAHDRYLAQKMVKIFSREFLKETLNMRRKTAQLAVQFLKNRLIVIDSQLIDARQTLSVYKTENLFSLPDIYLDGSLNLMESKKSLMESELELKEIISQLELLRASISEYNPTLNQVYSRLFKIKQHLIGLRFSFTEKHPIVIRNVMMKIKLEKLAERI
ncbi:MAG: hypothetical protein HRT89_18935, partial [Lentisphaeria bacterium]|nr:hypothetical protein [Lentisphaeria bacterium]